MNITWLMAFLQELLTSAFTGKTPFAHTLKHLNSQAPSYQWGNLGYWQGCMVYATAAQALADQLVYGIDVKNNKESVLVLGCGHGEELRHWSASRVCSDKGAYGVDIDPAAIDSARKANPDAMFFVGDADGFLVSAKGKQQHFELICALDCAYHFQGRANTWQLAYEQLAANGVLALSDLVLAEGAHSGIKQTLWLKFASAVFSIPFNNWMTSQAYQQELEYMGFEIQYSHTCGDEVLDGFYEFTQGPLFEHASVPKSWMLKSKITAYLIKKLREHNLIDYQIIQAQKI